MIPAVARVVEQRDAEAAVRRRQVGPALRRHLVEVGAAGAALDRAETEVVGRQLARRREPERRLMDLNPLVDDAVELTLLGHRRGTKLVREFGEELPQVQLDPVQIQQVVVNLVRNALEAVKNVEAPEVHVITRVGDNCIEMAVRDNGPGIPLEAVPNLFRAFVTSKRTGLGLGLAISRTIAQNHGGDLIVDPGGLDRGACFVLQLPVLKPAVP